MNKNPDYVGFENYRTIFADEVFWQSVGQTLYFTLLDHKLSYKPYEKICLGGRDYIDLIRLFC